MTLPAERSRALIEAEKLLVDLINPKATPGVPKAIRQRALRVARHYPSLLDLSLIASFQADTDADPDPQGLAGMLSPMLDRAVIEMERKTRGLKSAVPKAP